MYPLVIMRRVGKVIDHFPGAREPVAGCHVVAVDAGQFSRRPEFECRHAIAVLIIC